MVKKIAEVALRISVIETENGKELSVIVEREGTNHEVMNLCEAAQFAELIGEAGVEKVLLAILNDEEDAVEMQMNDTAH